ncbi:MAG: hypothetical protein ACKOWW_00465 [Flavobacteriales bacterium]
MHLLSAFSFWWSVPIIATALLISWRFYTQESWLSKKSNTLKRILLLLRTSTLSIIGLLLLGLTFELLEFKTEPPIIVTLVDHSASMLNDTKASTLNQQIGGFQRALKEKFQGDYQFDTYYFGADLQKKTKGYLDQKTNMELAFEQISTNYFNKNLGALVLISDGNYNVGANPSYQASHLPLTPIYGLAVGDTTLKKDQLITNVAYNELTFLNNEFPIEVDIEAYRLGGQSATLSLFEDGRQIDQQIIRHQAKFQATQTINFKLKAKKPGVRAYRLVLSGLPGEFSLQNNVKTIYIEVADSRRQILLLANAPHPDIAAISQALKGNENYQLSFKTPSQVRGALRQYDLVIWHEPSNGFDSKLIEQIKTSQISTWFILGSQAEMSSVRQLPIGLQLQLRQQLEEVQTYAQDGFTLFEPDRQWLPLVDQFPPLQRKFGEVKTLGSTQILLKQRIGQILKNEPLLSFSEFKQQRVACLLGEGIWRWKLQAYQKTQRHDAFQAFIGQICNYLLVQKEGMGLRVQVPVRLDATQDFLFNASFYNASLQAITTPKISWELRNDKGQTRKGELQTKGAYYQYQLGKLAPGSYSWKVQTRFKDKIYTKTGKLIVESIQLEQQESAARHATLQQLANQSGAKVFPLKSYQKLIQELENTEDIVAVRTETHQFKDLNDYLLILFVLFGLLTTEWFLRRFNGAY